jgi:DNA-binding protein HU-beta
VTKSEFVDQVADRAGLSKKDASDAVDAMLETIEDALKRGSDVTFSGFGKFSVSDRSAREVVTRPPGRRSRSPPRRSRSSPPAPR